VLLVPIRCVFCLLPPRLLFTHHWTEIVAAFTSHLELTENSSEVKVTLRLTVSQPVNLGVEPHVGLMTRYLLLFDSYGLVFVGRPLWRENGSVSRPYFTVKLPFSSPPTSSISPNITRVALYILRADRIEDSVLLLQRVYRIIVEQRSRCWPHRIQVTWFLASEFIGALLVAQQRAINSRTSIVGCVPTRLPSRCLTMLWPSTLQYYCSEWEGL
jgi:hypothetical protein